MNTKHLSKRKYTVAAMALIVVGLLFSSCDKLDFGGMNTDPTKVTHMPPGFIFSTTELAVSGTRYEVWRANLLYTENIVQHLVTTFFSGGNNYSKNVPWEIAFYLAAYNGGINGQQASQVKRIETVIHLLKQQKKKAKKLKSAGKTVPTKLRVANKLAEARILRVFIYSRITDLYGDIPYFEAGQGAITGNIHPKFTPQKKIYHDFFKELSEAVKQFDPSKPTFGDHDLIYGGNIAKWKNGPTHCACALLFV